MITNEWPSGVVNGADTSAAPPGVMDPSGCDPVVAELVAEIKPRSVGFLLLAIMCFISVNKIKDDIFN